MHVNAIVLNCVSRTWFGNVFIRTCSRFYKGRRQGQPQPDGKINSFDINLILRAD